MPKMYIKTVMSSLRRCSTYALYSRFRIYELSPRRVCGSYKYSSCSRFKDLLTPNFLCSSLDRQQRCRYIHPRLSTSDELVTQKSTFQKMISFRQKQAKCSVLIKLSSKSDIPYILNLCKQYGEIKNMIVFVDKQLTFQAIAEFVHEESVQRFLADASLKNITEMFPNHSRCLYFVNKAEQPHADLALGEVIDLSLETNNCRSKGPLSVSEMMVELYEREKISDLSIRLRFLSCVMLQEALSGMFPHCTILPFGSSVNGLGSNNSDLDMTLSFFSEEQVFKNPELFFQAKWTKGNSHELQQVAIRAVKSMLFNFIPGVRHMRLITNARMPIINYENHLLSLQCDISFNNMLGVPMSEIIFLCGELDPRVHPLMYTIKKWVRMVQDSSEFQDKQHQITSFPLSMVILFFLQSHQVPVLPPLNKLIGVPLPSDYRSYTVEHVNKEDSKTSKPVMTGQNSESLGSLLQAFFNFFATFPFKKKQISVNSGTASSRKGNDFAMWIEHPMDELYNVSKNVTFAELSNLCNSARTAAENLETYLKHDASNATTSDLMSILGGLECDSSHKVGVKSLVNEPCGPKNKQ